MSNIDALARAWLDAKSAETKAQKERYAIEAQLCEALETNAEGAITHKLEDYKVTLNQPVTRKLDPKAWELVKDDCPQALRPVKVRLEADATGCKWLHNNEPEIWRKIAQAFETKPGKVGVKVEAI